MQFIDLKAQQERIREALDARIAKVLDHGRYIMGPEVAEFERALSDFGAGEHVVSCSSGTDALLLPLMAWGVGPGDAVFVPSFTFCATAEVVALLGATPVFVDVKEDDFNMDPESLARAIEEVASAGELRPKVVIPVDLFGQCADYPAINGLARAHGMKVLADAAQACGATLDGKQQAYWADAVATSFFPAKPLGCYGDGGAVMTNDAELADVMRSIRVHGKGSDKYDNVRIGLNARLDTLQAAILLEKLAIYPEEIELRNEVAARYNEALRDVAAVPEVPENKRSVWAQYTLRLKDRDAVQQGLKEAGIPSVVYYPKPLHRQTAYASFPTAGEGLPVSERLSQEVLSLPMHPYLSEADISNVAQVIRDAGKGEG